MSTVSDTDSVPGAIAKNAPLISSFARMGSFIIAAVGMIGGGFSIFAQTTVRVENATELARIARVEVKESESRLNRRIDETNTRLEMQLQLLRNDNQEIGRKLDRLILTSVGKGRPIAVDESKASD